MSSEYVAPTSASGEVRVSKSAHKQFLLITLSIVCVVGAPLVANYVLLWSSGELTRLERVIEAQINDDALYGTALHDVRREHKLALIRYREPKIVALGSSRALDFRQEYFTKKFACACQAMKSLEEGTYFVDAMMQIHQPDLVLFAIDYWWLTGPERANRGPPRRDEVVLITKDKLFQPFEWLKLGKITYSDYVQLILGNRELADVSRHPKIGIHAIKTGFGIRGDGSHFLGMRFSAQGHHFYRNARRAIAGAATNVLVPGHRYGPDQVIRQDRVVLLREVVQRMQDGGASVVLVLPPIVPEIIDAWASTGRHEFMPSIVEALQEIGDEFYDFHEPRELGSNTCEFADTRHGGNTLYMRMLREILLREPDSAVKDYVDREWLDENIERFAGLTVATFRPELYMKPELDFLGLGCHKTHIP